MVTDYFDVKLETKDLILKKAEFEDWKTIYYNLWRHKESAKYMLWQPTETDEDAKDRMKRTIAFEEKPENKYALQLSCGFVFDSLSEEKTDPRTGETYVLENHIYRY